MDDTVSCRGRRSRSLFNNWSLMFRRMALNRKRRGSKSKLICRQRYTSTSWYSRQRLTSLSNVHRTAALTCPEWSELVGLDSQRTADKCVNVDVQVGVVAPLLSEQIQRNLLPRRVWLENRQNSIWESRNKHHLHSLHFCDRHSLCKCNRKQNWVGKRLFRASSARQL